MTTTEAPIKVTSHFGARFSADRIYRYALYRDWGDGPNVNFVMLNPSTANERTNDPTVERCVRRAQHFKYGRLVVTNIFAYRATDPQALRLCADPVGPENDEELVYQAGGADLVICAWGYHGTYLNRGDQVKEMLLQAGIKLHALDFTAGGQPRHPLYLPYSLVPVEW